MNETRLTENLIQLTRLKAVNVYLLLEEDGVTVIDTGIAGSGKGILEATQRLGRPVQRILLTHAHDDHAGSVDALLKELPDVELLVAAREERLRRGDKQGDPGEKNGSGLGTIRKGTPATRTFEPGERIGSLEVIASPGHSPGHVSFLDTRDRSLIAGDAFKTLGGLSHTGRVHPGFPFPGIASWDRARAAASARTLAELSPTLLAVGHGSALRDPAEAMRRDTA